MKEPGLDSAVTRAGCLETRGTVAILKLEEPNVTWKILPDWGIPTQPTQDSSR
jgi:hypothetical protein